MYIHGLMYRWLVKKKKKKKKKHCMSNLESVLFFQFWSNKKTYVYFFFPRSQNQRSHLATKQQEQTIVNEAIKQTKNGRYEQE
jgi:hypothetical protein